MTITIDPYHDNKIFKLRLSHSPSTREYEYLWFTVCAFCLEHTYVMHHTAVPSYLLCATATVSIFPTLSH